MDKIGNIKEVFDALNFAFGKFGEGELWWRGNSDSECVLVPLLYQKGGLTYERNIYARFVLRAQAIHSKCPDDKDLAGWRFLMQHYRLPTRLLDWSQSILTATFFAVNEYPDKDGALWVLDPYVLNKYISGDRVVFNAGSDVIQNLYEFRTIEKVVAIAPPHLDVRMMIQSSVFTIHGSKKPLESYEDSDKYLYKFVIPADVKDEIKKTLKFVGIKESFLFPGLEYLARELSSQTYTETDE